MIPQEQGPSLFGRLPDGRAIEAVRIGRGALRAEILTYGAVVRDLRFDGHGRPLVLGLDSMEDYLAHSRNFGASPGRCANRIAGGRFVLDGKAYELERNEPGGVNHIHGGSAGMGRSPWTIRALTPDHVELRIRDPAGNAGFPGTVETTCTIRVSEAGVLAIRYESRCDAPCPVNLCHHGYFNLGRGPDIRDHTVRIAADAYLPVDDRKIPLGAPQAVAGTPFDLRADTLLGERLKELDGGFDHNFCLSPDRMPLRPIAWVSAPTGLRMEVATTEPGVQFFTAPMLRCPVPGLEGQMYGPAAGLCLETQVWPDAVNQTGFPDVVLRPGEIRVQETEYRFFRTPSP